MLCCLLLLPLLPLQCWGSTGDSLENDPSTKVRRSGGSLEKDLRSTGDSLEKDCIAPHMGKDTLYLVTLQMPLWSLKAENFTELDKKINASIRQAENCTTAKSFCI